MPRQVLIVNWCDPCYAEDNRTEGESVVIKIGHRKSDKARELVLCDLHRKELLDPLAHVLAEAPVYKDDDPSAAATPAAPKETTTRPYKSGPANPVQCDICKEVFGIDHTAKNESSLHTHRLQRHEVSSVEYKAWRRGDATVEVTDQEKLRVKMTVKPLPPKSDTKWVIPDDFHCGVEGCDYVIDPRDYDDGEQQAYRVLGAHRNSKHADRA